MYKLKSIVRRGSTLVAALAVAAGTVLPSTAAFADALNPLTHRSLALSSSAPGWDHTDGSGNITYAQPNSGANGQKTGNTFQFNVSSGGTTVKAFTFQYCTTSAGDCTAPGNDTYTGTAPSATRNGDSVASKQSDLKVTVSTPTEVSTGDYSTIMNSDGTVKAVPNRDDSEGNFVVLTSTDGTTWTQVDGWVMRADNKEDGTAANETGTGKENFITITNSGGFTPAFDQMVKVIFFATDTNYITNPGAGAFFVKINDYADVDGTTSTLADYTTLVDGGVTVANVMNQSIEIQTKVLETMDFSVGTIDPNTLSNAELHLAQTGSAGSTTHGTCDRILGTLNPSTPLTNPVNTLQMGRIDAENSLETDKTYSTHSYWRLSSNSSAGATVYYSGVTLSNTVGDQIDAIGATATQPHVGTEQFGLALANGTIADNDVLGPVGGTYANGGDGLYHVNYAVERGGTGIGGVSNLEDAADNGQSGTHASTTTDVGGNGSYHTPRLYPLIPETDYDSGAGVVNANYSGASESIDTKFAFDPNSNLIPTPIATENNQVVDCVTGKMRYIANIAATTPAGIYTTKVNYIAAPQY